MHHRPPAPLLPHLAARGPFSLAVALAGRIGWRFRPTAACTRWVLAAVVCLAPAGMASLRAQNTSADYPTGEAGDFNGDVTTAGRYDPYTANVKRIVTDLVVPGSNGVYPLAFTRTFNANVDPPGNDAQYFGDGLNWRHSYQWSMTNASTNVSGAVTGWTVNYPDGSSVVYTPPNTTLYPNETYWRGPVGTKDRLDLSNSSMPILHTSDGGQVVFANSYRATSIIDPNGATTKLTYATTGGLYSTPPIGYLTQVTEPGGRTLSFTYTDYTKSEHMASGSNTTVHWFLLTKVTASTGQSGSYPGQSVSYQYTMVGNNENSLNSPAPYEALTSVTYNDETSVNGGGTLTASYGVSTTPAPADLPQLANAVDPHYAGAMNHIQYAYSSTTGTYTLEEQNYGGNPGEMLSHLHLTDSTSSNAVTVSTETRGDHASGGAGITRTFNYGQSSAGSISSTGAQPYHLTSVTDFQGNTTCMGYDPQGYLTQVEDSTGQTTLYAPEPIAGHSNTVQYPDNTTCNYSWTDKTDTVSSPPNPYYLHTSTDPRGNVTTYTHDHGTGLVTKINHPDGGVETFTYQALSYGTSNPYFYKVSSHVTVLGANLYYYYDQSGHGGSGHPGLLTSVMRYYADGYGNGPQETTNLYYDSFDRVNKVVDPRGVTDTYAYNARHQVTSVTHSADNTSQVYTYNDDYGWLTSVQDELGHTTTTAYDEYGRPVSVTQPVNAGGITTRTTYTTYDGRDNTNAVIADALSHTSSQFSYQVLPSGRGVQHIYSPDGWLTDVYAGQTSGSPGTSGSLNFPQCLHTQNTNGTNGYDAMGRLLSSADAQGNTWSYGYDECGRRTSATDPLGHTTNTAYYVPGSSTYNNPHYLGLVAAVTTPGGIFAATVTTTYTSYDAMGRLTGWTAPSGTSGTTSFSSGFDPAGDVTSQSDGNAANPATGYAFDQLGRKIALTYADGTTEQWHYDASGNVSTYKNRAGNTQTYNAYNGRNRPTGWSWANTNPASAIAFDAAGRCTSMNNGYSVLNMTYDDANALLSEQQNIGGASAQTVSYAPDADGHVASVTYPGGATASWPGLDYLGRVQQVETTPAGATSATLLASCGYADTWLSYTATSGNVYNAYGYQANGRIDATSVYHASGQNISYRTYGFYPNGQLSWFQKNADNGSSGSALENGAGEYFYAYNNAMLIFWGDEVPAVAGSANAQGDSAPASTANAARADAYQYDGAGNRTDDQESTGVNQPSFDGENRQSGVSYDANGNATSQSWNNAGYTYAFDALNQLTSASGGGNSASFVYDPKGRLCQRTVNGVVTRLYYAGRQLVQENDGSNNPLNTYYYYGPGGALAARVSNTGYKIFWEYDARGFLTHLTNGPGNVIEQYLYHSFGTPYVYDATGTQPRGQTSGVLGGNRFLWAQGYEWYPEIGLYHCGARFYSPALGRFMQPDPIGQKGGLNIYSYCGNDPINKTDASGLFDGSTVPLQSTGDGSGNPYDDGDGNTADSEDPRDADPIISTGPAPTGSHIPSSTYTQSNAQGVALIGSIPWQGTEVLWQSSPSVTTIGGLSAVAPPDGDGYGEGKVTFMGIGQGYSQALDAAIRTDGLAVYDTNSNWWYDLFVAIYQKLQGSNNNQSAIDAAAYLSGFASPSHIEAYSQGTLDVVEAIYSYHASASSITFSAPAVSITGAQNATSQAGASFGGYNQNYTDISSIYAPSYNPLKFFSGVLFPFNTQSHSNYSIMGH